MSETPVPRDPGPDQDPPGVPAGPGDRPWLGSPDWQLVPQRPDWPEWMDDDAHAGDEDPGDLEEYEDPDCAPPADLDDAELASPAVGFSVYGLDASWPGAGWLDSFGYVIGEEMHWVRLGHQSLRTGAVITVVTHSWPVTDLQALGLPRLPRPGRSR